MGSLAGAGAVVFPGHGQSHVGGGHFWQWQTIPFLPDLLADSRTGHEQSHTGGCPPDGGGMAGQAKQSHAMLFLDDGFGGQEQLHISCAGNVEITEMVQMPAIMVKMVKIRISIVFWNSRRKKWKFRLNIEFIQSECGVFCSYYKF